MMHKNTCRTLLAGALGALCLGIVGAGAVPAAASVSATGTPASLGFNPMSVTFVSLGTGWALGTLPCKSSGTCLALEKTTDAGRSWANQPLPPALLDSADRSVTNGIPKGSPGYTRLPAALYGPYGLGVRFADAEDGWIYGGLALSDGAYEAVLWSTHDGGATWHHLPVLPGNMRTYDTVVFDLEAAGGAVYLMAPNSQGGVSVESSPVGSDSWHLDSTPALGNPAGGGEQDGAFVFQGGKGWLVEGNDRGVTGSAQLVRPGASEWKSWAAPCANVGNSFFVPAASTSANLVDVCQMGGFAFPLSKSAPKGATIGSYWLYASSNSGVSFSAEQRLGGNGYPFAGLVASPKPGVVLVGSGFTGTSEQELLASFNGGRSWAPVYKGDLFYLGFTSPSQGVGLVRSSLQDATKTEMIMTFDGGGHWSEVSF